MSNTLNQIIKLYLPIIFFEDSKIWNRRVKFNSAVSGML